MEENQNLQLTENKSNQFNSINICDSLNSIQSHRKTIKIKSKEHLFLTEEPNNIKNTKSKNYIMFPKINNCKIIQENNSFTNYMYPLEKSSSYSKSVVKTPDYINLNKLFLFPKVPGKSNNREKFIFNYSNSIDIQERRRLLNGKKYKNIKCNFPKNKNININPLKIYNQKKKDELYEIKHFMKMKYYEDVNDKMEKKLKDDTFFDKADKIKLIKIGKFHVFWKNVFDYCGGFIFSEKMKNTDKTHFNSMEETKNKTTLKKHQNNRIFTSILKSKLIHYKNNYGFKYITCLLIKNI